MNDTLKAKLVAALASTLNSEILQALIDVDYTLDDWQQVLWEALWAVELFEGDKTQAQG